MEILHAVNPFFAFSGFVVGALVGLTGVGGGSLMTPLLVLIFGVQATTAVGTDLLYAATTKTVGAVAHHRRGTIDWRVTRRLANREHPGNDLDIDLALRVRGPRWCIAAAHHNHACLRADPDRDLRRLAPVVGTADATRRSEPNPRRVAALTVTAGLVLGVLVKLSSAGAGAIGMTALVLLYPRTPIAKLEGSETLMLVGIRMLHS